MFRIFYVLILVMLFEIIIFNCQKGDEKKAFEKKTVPVVPEKKEIPSVCIWDDASVRAEPSVEAKKLSALALGEKVTWLGEEESDQADTKRKYLKIRLSDGTEGWASEIAVTKNAKPSIIVKKTPIYLRPDLLTLTNSELEPMDMVAVLKKENDWLEVIGEKREHNGWIQSDIVSFKEEDIAAALLARKALAEGDDKEKRAKIKSLLKNPAFAYSIFSSELKRKLHELSPVDDSEIPTVGLVAYYPFNSNANDESGNKIDGASHKAQLTYDINGNQNQAYRFNGSDGGYVNMGSSSKLNLGKTGTISLFVNIHSYESNEGKGYYPGRRFKKRVYWHILGKGARAGWDSDGYCIFYHNEDQLIYGVLTNKAEQPSFNRISFGKPNTSEWHHFVMVWDGYYIRAYIDGKIFGSPVEQTITLPETQSEFLVGKKSSERHGEGHAGFYDGIVDQIRIYDRALSEPEIQNLYKSKL
jgi:hypothetical protein